MFFILVNAQLKWPEVYKMNSTTSLRTISVLRQIFTTYKSCLTWTTVHVNRVANFLRKNGVKHIQSTPYYPSSNGLVEHFIKSFKLAMRAGDHLGLPSNKILYNLLWNYRSTPHELPITPELPVPSVRTWHCHGYQLTGKPSSVQRPTCQSTGILCEVVMANYSLDNTSKWVPVTIKK